MTLDAAARRRLGRALTRLANASVEEILALAADEPGTRARRIGVTGPPGAGKSSLVGRLATLRSQSAGASGAESAGIGVLAIDPTSPRSGGAILGDRIRMDELAGARDLYVRSLASRTAADGLADNLPELLAAMDAAGFDEVLVETVGVGQVEHAVRSLVETLVLVTVPESGDFVQAMKAGLVELADLIVVNKADLPGAARTAAEIRRALHLAPTSREGHATPVLLASIQDAASIAALSAAIDERQRSFVGRTREGQRTERARYRLKSLLERRAAEIVRGLPDEAFDRPLARQYAQATGVFDTAARVTQLAPT